MLQTRESKLISKGSTWSCSEKGHLLERVCGMGAGRSRA